MTDDRPNFLFSLKKNITEVLKVFSHHLPFFLFWKKIGPVSANFYATFSDDDVYSGAEQTNCHVTFESTL